MGTCLEYKGDWIAIVAYGRNEGASAAPYAKEDFGGTEPLRPFGAPPLAGEAFGVGVASLCPCCTTVLSVRVAFVAYA